MSKKITNNIYGKSIIELVGNTPLVRLNKLSEQTGCEILGKCEFLNPGQSIKDRAALSIIMDAKNKGLLKDGGMIVEGTAGNTGIGLSLIGNALGHKSTIIIPDNQSQEKKDVIRFTGAKLIEVPAVPYSNPNNYIRYSERVTNELNDSEANGAYWANQFDNVANQEIHIKTTSQEIYRDLDGKIDGFVCSVGTGGSLSGISIGLKEKSKDITIACVDPMGSGIFNYYKDGKIKSAGSSITEGIGQGRITKNLENAIVDEAFQASDVEALPFIYDLIENEGISVGLSSAINMAGAYKLAKELGEGKVIVTLLCDYANRYQNKLFNKEFLKSKDLPYPEWL